MRFAAGTLLALALLGACAPRRAAPAHSPRPQTTAPVYFGARAARFELVSRPLGFDPDGNARWLVVARFLDARGRATRIMANSDLDWNSGDGYVQWQNRMRFGQPSAIVKTVREGPIVLTVRCNVPALGTRTIRTDTRFWRFPRVTGASLGAHAAQVGWFPQASKPVRIARTDLNDPARVRTWTQNGGSFFRDSTVAPQHRYRYTLTFDGTTRTVSVSMPAEAPARSISAASGMGMWLYFSTNPLDAIYYRNLEPQAIIDQAVRAHLRYVELRTAYGAYWQITPDARPVIDAIVDGLASHRIATVGWTVPRDGTFEDLQASVRSAYYRTARGTPLGGVAVDLERGGDFMGGAPAGLDALWQYVRDLRAALGPRYPIVATVEDPYLEHLDERAYPYREIAQYASVLQPMTYWRMLRGGSFTPARTAQIMRSSYVMLQSLAMHEGPVSMGAQTSALSRTGAPPPSEIASALQSAKDAGAIGVCFFAWDGTQAAQWNALAAFHW